MKRVKILVACATGVATSTIVTEKINEICRENNIDAHIVRSNTAQMDNYISEVDIVMSTTKLDGKDIDKPVINALALITGIGEDQVINQLLEAIESLG